MVEKGIYNILSNYAGLTSITSQISLGIQNKKNAYDNWVVYYVNSTDPHDTKTGVSTLNTAIVQVNCFSSSGVGSLDLAKQVRKALDRNSGTFNTVVIQSIQFHNESSVFNFGSNVEGEGIYQVSQFYNVRYEPDNS